MRKRFEGYSIYIWAGTVFWPSSVILQVMPSNRQPAGTSGQSEPLKHTGKEKYTGIVLVGKTYAVIFQIKRRLRNQGQRRNIR